MSNKKKNSPILSETKRELFFKIKPSAKRAKKKLLIRAGFKEGYKIWGIPEDTFPDEDMG